MVVRLKTAVCRRCRFKSSRPRVTAAGARGRPGHRRPGCGQRQRIDPPPCYSCGRFARRVNCRTGRPAEQPVGPASVLKYEPGTLPSCYAQSSSSSRHPIHPETDFVRSGSLYAILAVSKDAALLSKIDTMRVSDTRRHDATLTFDQTQIK